MTRSRQTADWGSRAGLAKIVPSSVAVGSGTGSSDSLGNVTFSGCSSVSLNSIADATKYTFYKVIVRITNCSADAELGLRLREATTDISAANYQSSRVISSNGSISGSSQSNGTYMYIGEIDVSAAGFGLSEVTIRSLAINEYVTYNFINGPLSTSTTRFSTSGSGYYGVTSANINGITILPSSGNITGSLSVYGHN
jgi:hypothetical protein